MEYKWDFPWISHGFPMGSVPMDSHPILGLPQDLHGTWHLRSKGHEAQRPGPVCNIGSYWILLDPIGWFSWGKPLFIKQPVGNGHPWHYQQSCSTHGWQDMGSEHEWTMSWDACLQEDHDQRILGRQWLKLKSPDSGLSLWVGPSPGFPQKSQKKPEIKRSFDGQINIIA